MPFPLPLVLLAGKVILPMILVLSVILVSLLPPLRSFFFPCLRRRSFCPLVPLFVGGDSLGY